MDAVIVKAGKPHGCTFAQPLIKAIVLQALQQWITCHEPNLTLHDPLTNAALTDQQTIGWDNFFLGIGASKWSDCQQCHYDFIGKCNTGKQRLEKILWKMINVLWDLWNHQNDM